MLDEEQRKRIVDIAYECISDTMKLTHTIDVSLSPSGTLQYTIDFKGFKEKFNQLFNNALHAAEL